VTRPTTFPWHDQAWVTPPFHDFIIYQLHIGAFFAQNDQGQDVRRDRVGTFLDAAQKIEYLRDLGVTAIQLLPIQEFQTSRSLGYNGTNYFAPEVDYSFDPLDPDFQRCFDRANDLLARKGLPLYQPSQLDCQTKQLMAFIDLCHVCGLAVIFDVVYNHAGGNFGTESIYFYDRQREGNQNHSLYFTDKEWAGGLGFAFWQNPVRHFLIDNARFFMDEYHVDGYRYDEVTVIDSFGGWYFLRPD
jgi:1,4-alpha-glucan branching enzyme